MNDRVRRTLVVVPPLAWLLVFFAVPLAIMFAISLADPASGVPPYTPIVRRDVAGTLAWMGDLENYASVLSDSYYARGYLDSIQIAAIVTLLCLTLGFPMTYAIARTKAATKLVLLFLVMLPFWTSFLIRVYAWIGILNTNGYLNTIFLAWGIVDEPIPLLYSEFAVYIGLVYAYLPFMVLPIFAVLERQDPALLEAAADLGAHPWNAFVRVTLPLSLPGVLAGSILVFVPAVGEFVIPELLGGSDFVMIGRLLWTEVFANRDWPIAAAIAILVVAFVVAPLALIERSIARRQIVRT
ncbi:MAG: ABC transporter permease subunit [Alphaproteobacteria bacterium]|nr:ABC transporter permease subunit [Alphaproteobacteria bacterium]